MRASRAGSTPASKPHSTGVQARAAAEQRHGGGARLPRPARRGGTATGGGRGLQPDPLRRCARPRLVRRRVVPPAPRPPRPEHRLRRAAAARVSTPLPGRLRLRWGDAHVTRGDRRGRAPRRAAVRLSRGSRLVAPCRSPGARGARRAGQRRPPQDLGVDGWRCVSDLVVLRRAQRPGRRGAVRPARSRGDCAPSRRVGARAPGAGVALAAESRGCGPRVLDGWNDARRRRLGGDS